MFTKLPSRITPLKLPELTGDVKVPIVSAFLPK